MGGDKLNKAKVVLPMYFIEVDHLIFGFDVLQDVVI